MKEQSRRNLEAVPTHDLPSWPNPLGEDLAWYLWTEEEHKPSHTNLGLGPWKKCQSLSTVVCSTPRDCSDITMSRSARREWHSPHMYSMLFHCHRLNIGQRWERGLTIPLADAIRITGFAISNW